MVVMPHSLYKGKSKAILQDMKNKDYLSHSSSSFQESYCVTKRVGKDSTATFPGRNTCVTKREKRQLKRGQTFLQHFPINLLRQSPEHSIIIAVV